MTFRFPLPGKPRLAAISLWSYLSLVTGGVLLAGFLGFGFYVAEEQSSLAGTELRAITRAVASNIDASAADDILEQRWDNLETLLIRLSAISNISELTLTDGDGKIIAQVFGTGHGPGRTSYSPAGKLDIPPQEHAYEKNGQYTYAKPINRGTVIGAVFVTSSLETEEAIHDHIWRDTLRAAAIAITISVILLGLALRRVIRDLASASSYAGNLVDHRGGQLAISSGIFETRQLADALNLVSEKLAAQHRALADSEVRKSAIMEAALDCFITIDETGRIVDFNGAAERTFGYQSADVRGLKMSEAIVPPALRSAHEAGMKRYLESGHGPILRQRIEITAMRRNGEEFPVEIAIVPFEAEGHTFFAGFLRDITDRKALEAEQVRVNALLKQSLSELEYQKFALDQHSIVSIANANGDITYANEKFTEISGYTLHELIGSNHRLIKSQLHTPDFYEQLWTTISSGKVWHGQIANRRKSGEIYWVASTIVPGLDANGIPYQYISIRTDITAQKDIEHALEESRRRELETGNEIQRSLLLGDLPSEIHGAAMASYTEPSQGIDGDFFAISQFRPDTFELLVGDVMGKGVPAALIGAAVKSGYNQVIAELFAATQTGSDHLPTPADIINALHQHLTPRLIELSTFVTLALYRFDIEAETVTFVNAGHTPGLLAHHQSGLIETILGNNLPIGVMLDETYEQMSLPIVPGDSLLVFSDGITEASDSNRNEYGTERLRNLMRAGREKKLPPNVLLQSLRQDLRLFVGHKNLLDDQTAVMVELLPRRNNPRLTIDARLAPEILVIPWRLDALEPLRQRVKALSSHLTDTDTDALTLASFEAATNIIRHASPYFSDATLTCRLTRAPDQLTVDLIYPGEPFEPGGEPAPDFSGNSDGGFGLYIILNSVDSVTYDSLLPGISCVRLVKHASGTPDEIRRQNILSP